MSIAVGERGRIHNFVKSINFGTLRQNQKVAFFFKKFKMMVE